MLKKGVLFYCFFLLLQHCHAQLYPFTLFNTSNGLVNNRCGNIMQDSSGYIWVGTDNGICNYDGRRFNFFPGVSGTYYFAHSQSTMYKGYCMMGTNGSGLAKCSGKKIEFINVSPKNQGTIISGAGINDSTYLLARYGKTKKLLLLKGRLETEISLPGMISEKMTALLSVFIDAANNIWVGTDAGMVVYVKGNLQKPLLIPALTNKYINIAKQDFEQNVFISCSGQVYKIDRKALDNIEKAELNLFHQSADEIPTIGFLKNGDVLLAHMRDGVKQFSRNLQFIRNINISNTVWDILTDREGNTWFATENGLLRMRNLDVINFLSPAVAFTSITSGSFYKNDFIFSNGEHLIAVNVFNNDQKKVYTIEGANAYQLGKMLTTPGDRLWINTYPDKVSNNPVYQSFEYTLNNEKAVKGRSIEQALEIKAPVNTRQTAIINDHLFFLTDSGQLYMYRPDKALRVSYSDSTLPQVFTLLNGDKTQNQLWLTLNDKGIYRCAVDFVNEKPKLRLQQFIQIEAGAQKAGKKILCDRQGILWLGTLGDGISRYHLKNGRYVLKDHIIPPVISSVMINDMVQDSSGNMWIGSNNGIDKFSFDQTGKYSVRKGMFDNILTGRLIYFLKERHNKLYIGTTGSLAVANIAARQMEVAPLVNINHLTVNNINADSLLLQPGHHFQPGENNLSFEFVALSFINEKQTMYRYKLEGSDKEWSPLTTNFTTTYNQLSPGYYTFRVQAVNAENTWSEKDAVFSFSIEKPFYRHWLFYLICIGACFGIAYWLYRQKIASILAVEKTRQHISKDLHDDIGSGLSSITLMNAVLKNKIEKKPAEAAELAEKIETTSRQMIENMSDIVWSTNPGNDTMDKMQNRLQQFCADIFEDTDTVHKLSVSDALLKRSLPMQLRRDIYLVCKEIANNAAKYSHADLFTLTLSLEKDMILINATDDGAGFDLENTHSGNGLANIKQRVDRNKGTAELTTNPGTQWKIRIPV